MSTPPATPSAPASASTRRRASIGFRVGIALAALLSIADVIGGVTQLGAGALLPIEVAVFSIVMGLVSLALIPFAGRGTSWAIRALVAARALSSATALPAFFVVGVPLEGILSASVSVVLTIVCIVLVLVKRSGR
jgi:hypothetical protein